MEREKINQIIEYINNKSEYISYNYKLYDIYNRNLLPYLHERIDKDQSGESSRNEAKSRISAVNILPKIVDKLSKVYIKADVKVSSSNLSTLEKLENLFDFETARANANKMLNLNRCCALEPIFADNEQDSYIRVLPAHTFLVYSDDPINPNLVTHFIKLSRIAMNTKDSRYTIYTNEEIVTTDGDGAVIESIENPYGVIPFIYLSRDTVELMPSGSKDDFEMVTLLPLLLTDNNYALKFQAFSVLYTKDAKIKNMHLAPNAVWNIESSGQDGDKAEIGTINPSLKTEDAQKNILMQFELWLDTKNIKSSNLTNQSSGTIQAISGIAKAIDDADITDDVTYQRKIFSEVEYKLFKLIEQKGLAHGYSLPLNDLVISWEIESTIPELPKEKLERIILKKDNKLMTHLEAIKEANNLDSDELAQEILDRINQEQPHMETAPNVQRVNENQSQNA